MVKPTLLSSFKRELRNLPTVLHSLKKPFTGIVAAIALLAIGSTDLNAQECGFEITHDHRLQNDPEYALKVNQTEQRIQSIINQQTNTAAQFQIIEDVIQIPVVVHVIHTGTAVGVGANISDDQIDSAIIALNDRYRKTPGTHGDASGVDTKIQFVLASRDPNCDSTSGIVRVNGSSVTNYATMGMGLGTSYPGADEVAVKDLSRWPNTDYMNIWVVSEIGNNNGGFGVQGFAYFPGASAEVDGLVVQHTSFGTTGTVNSWNNLNRTVTHEVGHYLGLYHTFEGDSSGTGCPPVTNGCGTGLGDCISDTEPHIRSSSNCPTGTTNTCTGSTVGLTIRNYMDYSSQTCADMFTSGQKARMRAVLWGPRAGLITSQTYLPPDTFNMVSAACTPQTTNLSNNFGIGIINVKLDSLDVTSDDAVDDSGYVDRTCSQLEYLDTNTSYTVSITTGYFNDEDVRAYIDYNNDGDFLDSGELIFTNDTDTFHSGTFTTPSSPVLNEKLRFRVVSDWHGNTSTLNTNGSCHTPTYGQVEDFAIMFVDTNVTTPLSVTIDTNSNVSCNGLSDGELEATPTGGTSPYTYLWSNGATGATASSLAAGTYTVTVTDNSGSTATASATITQPTTLSVSASGTNPSSSGAADGTTLASASGGTTAYAYTWNTGASGASETGLTAGTYCVTVTDANACTDSTCVTITDPVACSLSASASVTSNVSCNGLSDGQASASFSGAQGFVTYSWSNGTFISSISGLAVGTYTVTITDTASCTDTASVTITQPSVLSASASGTNVTTNGGSDGTATASASGGTTAYTFAWNNGGTTATITGLAAGNYCVTVTDANACTDTACVTITEPAVSCSLSVSASTISNVSCNGLSDGQASASASNGLGAVTYAWSNGATSASIAGLAAGTYTVTATDSAGCTSTSSVSITQPSAVSASATGTNVTTVGGSDGTASASASGGTAPYSYVWTTADTNSSLTGLVAGSYCVTVTDASGCTDSACVTLTEPSTACSLSVSVNITSAITCPGDTTGQLSASVSSSTGTITYSWSNGGTGSSISSLASGTYSVIVSDTTSCADTAYATLSAADTTAPTVFTQAISLHLNASGNASTSSSAIDNGSNDNCGIASMSLNDSVFDCSDVGTNTVTLTVVDNNGNSNSTTAMITVIDSTSPSASTQNITLNLNGSGNATTSSAAINNGSSDNCGIASMSLSDSTFNCNDIGVNAITLTVTDASGNTSTETATVTIVDNTAPTIATQNISVALNASGQASITSSSVDNGTSDNCSIASLSLNDSVFDCTDIGMNTVTLTAVDASGNVSSSSATVTIVDNSSPSVSAQNITLNLGATGTVSTSSSAINNGSSDNCGIASISLNDSVFNCSDIGSNTVTLTVVDVNGNSSSETATVTVQDVSDPTAAGQNLTLYLGATGTVSTSAAMIDNGSSDNCAITSLSLNDSVFNCNDIGANSITLTAIDGSGNSDSDVVTITVVDTTSPSVTAQNITVNLDASGNATITSADVNNGSSDNCSIVSLSLSDSVFSCADTGSNTVTLTAVDGSGNTSSSTCIVTIADATAPVLNTQSATLYLDANGDANLTVSQVNNGSFDNCALASLTLSDTSFSCINIGPNTVIMTGTDISGNVSTAAISVTIVDTIFPVIHTHVLTVALDNSGSATISTSQVDSASFDNCSPFVFSLIDSTFDCSDVGLNQVGVVVTDISGNQAFDFASVTVIDTLSPVLSVTPLTLYLDGSGSASTSAVDVDNGTTDNCGIASLSLNDSLFSCSDTGINPVVFTATDVNGNTITTTVDILVLDTISPTAIAQNVTAYLDATGNVVVSASMVDNGSADNCSVQLMTLSDTAFDCSSVGVHNVTLSVTDPSGNTSTDQADITVLDTISPTLSCSGDTVICEGLFTSVGPGVSDNCGAIWMLNQGFLGDSVLSPATYSMSFSAVDSSGNISTCSYDITVNPNPVVNLGNDTNVWASANLLLSAQNAGSSYVWSDSSTLQTLLVDQNGTYSVTVTDSNGCSASDEIVVSFATSIDGIQGAALWSVYPNPTRNIVGISCSYDLDATIALTNQLGQVLFNNRSVSFRNESVHQLSLAEYGAGVYFLSIDTGSERKTVKLIVE